MENKQVSEPLLNQIVNSMHEIDPDSKIVKIQSVADFSLILFSNGIIYGFGNND